jgi:hypothetical protein
LHDYEEYVSCHYNNDYQSLWNMSMKMEQKLVGI